MLSLSMYNEIGETLSVQFIHFSINCPHGIREFIQKCPETSLPVCYFGRSSYTESAGTNAKVAVVCDIKMVTFLPNVRQLRLRLSTKMV